MPRAKANPPDWWLRLPISNRLRAKLRANFSIHRDGYVKWYRGAPRQVTGKRTPPDAVEAAWDAKRKLIDAAIDNVPAQVPAGVLTYRVALSEFLAGKEARVGAVKKRLAERTYHNYVDALNAFGNFTVDHRKIADTPLAEIGPRHFTAYAATFHGWKASGFDSVVTRVAALFRWAVDMEYIDRFRPGPDFVRPAKQELRDERIDLRKSFTPIQVAKLYDIANHTVRCWIALGICAAFNNSDIAHLTRSVIDLDTGIIDFRRRKTGKLRRVIPLPPDVTELLKRYRRPEPADDAWRDLFFITEHGNPFTRNVGRDGAFMPSNTVSRMFAFLMADAKLPNVKGQNFSGLRTTFRNLAPRGGYDLERKIIMGHAKGNVDLDSYLEDVGLDRLRHVVTHVWSLVQVEIRKLSSEHRGAAPSRSASPASVSTRVPNARRRGGRRLPA